jgi:hypothetical protein
MGVLAQEIGAELSVKVIIPDFGKGTLEQVAQDEALVITGGKGGNAAGQAVAIGGHIGSSPGAHTLLPGRKIGWPGSFQAVAWVPCS